MCINSAKNVCYVFVCMHVAHNNIPKSGCVGHHNLVVKALILFVSVMYKESLNSLANQGQLMKTNLTLLS